MVLLLLSIFTFLLAGKRVETKVKNSEWKRIKSGNEITTSSRWIALQSNNQIKEIKAEVFVQAPKDKLLDIIQSGVYTSEWMSMVDNYYVKQGISQNQWESQLILNLFWPLSKNSLEIDNNLLNNCEDSCFIIFRSKKASILNKTINPSAYQFDGCWELIQAGNNRTKVILKTKWNKRNILPHWLISTIFSDVMFNSLNKFKKLSEEKYKTESNFIAATAP